MSTERVQISLLNDHLILCVSLPSTPALFVGNVPLTCKIVQDTAGRGYWLPVRMADIFAH